MLHNDLNACNEYRHGLDTAAKITSPVHLLIGREDAMAPPRATRDLIAALSVVRVVELANCGHMLMAEQPDAVRRRAHRRLSDAEPLNHRAGVRLVTRGRGAGGVGRAGQASVVRTISTAIVSDTLRRFPTTDPRQ